SSGSTTLCRPRAVLGTSSVNLDGLRCARWRTASSRGWVAAVLCATTSTRAGDSELAADSLDSMGPPFSVWHLDHRTVQRQRRSPFAALAVPCCDDGLREC